MIEVLERDENQVYWRYNGLDGTSNIYMNGYDDKVTVDAELCDVHLILTTDKRNDIKLEVLRWLDETGERADWLGSKSW